MAKQETALSSSEPDASEANALGDAPANTPSLGQQTASGFLWLMFQTVGVKCVTTLGQVALAWLLIPEDFGMVALAYSVTTFIVILQASGVLEILIQRYKEFDELASPAFWMSLLIGTIVAVGIVVVAPFAAALYGHPELRGLLIVLAVSTFLSNLENVPIAALQAEMRFRPLSILGIGQGVVQTILSVIFAAAGFGAYSFILPLPIIGIFKLAVLWWLARPPVHMRLHLAAWPSLLRASGLLVAAAFFFGLYTQVASITLGLFHTAALVGLFHFANNLSLQVQTLLALNLSQVLLPSFSRLQEDPKRQTRAFLKATKVLMVIAAPGSLLVAALADPGVKLVFNESWQPAIPMLQLLSIGAAFNITSIVTMNLLKAQGRYEFHFWMAVVRSVGFMALVGAGAFWGGGVAVALGAALFMVFFGPLSMYASIRFGGQGWKDVMGVYLVPIGLGGLACACGAAAAWWIPEVPGREYYRIALTCAVAGLIYLPLARWLAADVWHDFLERVLPLVPVRFRRFVPQLLIPAGNPLRQAGA